MQLGIPGISPSSAQSVEAKDSSNASKGHLLAISGETPAALCVELHSIFLISPVGSDELRAR